MEAARVYANLSYCNRRKVGCVIVKDNRIISIGYNGTPAGADNKCEDDDGKTLPCVLHAEDNALDKLEAANETCEGATVFITTSPCYNCACRLLKHKVADVYYDVQYTARDGIDHLQKHGIPVEHLSNYPDN